MGFEGKTVVITGATSGIGEATARMFAEQGALVIAVGRNEAKGTELEAAGMKFFKCELTDPDAVVKLCEDITSKYENIDVLVNSAGISAPGTVETLSYEEWRYSFALNVDAMFLMCKYIIPVMRKQGGGRIINIGSTAGTVGAGDLQVYATTKGAVIQLTRSLAAAYSKENILCNALCPGGTLTPMMLKDGMESCDEFAQLFPIKRLAQPEEIASAILFLAGEGATFMTGATVLVDGGFTCI